jgi:DNA-binding transcriptional ArsR family regulator
MTAEQQQRMTITDPQVMRALAHPARLAIMEELGTSGAALTATEAAEVAGLSPSATSYHLRALARYGLVEEAPSRGDARERVWRSTVHSWQVDPGVAVDPETQAAEGALVDAYLSREVDRIRGWLARVADEPPEWASVALMSESTLLLTAEELATFNAELMRLIEPYKRRHRIANPPEGARTVAVTYKAVPLD